MLVAGPNLALDRLLAIDRLRPGEVQRFDSARVLPGGKGVNVCRAAARLGAKARLAGFLPGRTGHAVGELLEDEGISLIGIECAGEIRAALLIRERSGKHTVLNEPGPELRPGDWERFAETVLAALEPGEALVLSGSLPPGAPDGGYADLVVAARGRAGVVVVDAAGASLHLALAAAPDLVTPNIPEAEAAESHPVKASGKARERALMSAERLVAAGPRMAVVTAGEKGAAFSGAGAPMWQDAPRVKAINPIGAGDAFTAVMAAGLEAGRDPRETFAQAMLVAAASVEHPVPGVFDPDRVRKLA